MADVYTIELQDRVTGAAHRAEIAVLSLGKGLGRAGAGAEKFSLGLHTLGVALGDLASRAISSAIHGLVDIGETLYETATLASRSRLGFKTLFGGVEQGESAMKMAIDLSRKYGLSIEDVTSAVTMFKGANFDAGQIEYLVKLGADMRSLGSTTEQVTSAMLAFRKIQSQGYLQGDELAMLSEAGISVDKIYTRLGKTLGKSRQEIVKMQGTRQLMAGDVLNAAAGAILSTAGSTKFGEAGEHAANETIGGLIGRLKSNLGDDLFESVLAAEPSLVKGLQSILGGTLGADGDSIKEKLTGALVKVGEGLEQIGPQIPGFVKNIESLVEVLGNLAAVLSTVTSPFRAVGETLGSLFGANSGPQLKLTPEAQARDAQFRGALPSALEPGSDEAEAWMVNAQKAARRSLDPGDSFEIGKNWTEGLAGGITTGAPSVGAAAGNAAQGAIDATRETTKTHSPSQVAFALGENWTEGVALGIDEQADMAARASATVADQVVAEGAMSSKGTLATGAAAGDTFNSSKSAGSTIGSVNFDVHLGGGIDAGSDAIQQLRDFVEVEFAALLERAVEGSGA